MAKKSLYRLALKISQFSLAVGKETVPIKFKNSLDKFAQILFKKETNIPFQGLHKDRTFDKDCRYQFFNILLIRHDTSQHQ